jgi:hopanoid biosynthesis associated RND transporter like protein HpnN
MVVSIFLAATRLGFHTSRADLLNPHSDYNHRWLEYTKEFSDQEDVVVVVEGDNQDRVVPVLDEVAAAVAEESKLFHAILNKIDFSKVRGKGLYYLEPKDLAAIGSLVDQAEPVLQGDWSQLDLSHELAAMGPAMGGAGQPPDPLAAEAILPQLNRFTQGLDAALGAAGAYVSPFPEIAAGGQAMGELKTRHNLSSDGRTGFVLFRFCKEDKESFAQNSNEVDALRRLIDDVRQRHPETRIGLTGLPVIENDEMRSSNASITAATVLSFVGVFLVLVVAFGRFRHSAMTMIALVLGMVWSCGVVTVTIGHMNILSIAFGSILLGLGIDYGIYYVAGYLQMRRTAASSAEALRQTAVNFAPSITTGAMTSAISFFMVGFTEFTGVAELGIIAGSGILLCWLAQMTVLPAMIQISDARRPREALPSPLNFNLPLSPLFAKPRLVLALTLAGTVVLATGMRYLWYDYNLLNLQPTGLESVELERRMLSQSNLSASFALLVVNSVEEMQARKKQLQTRPTVDHVEEIASLFPPQVDQKRPIIEAIHRRLAVLPPTLAQLPQFPVLPPAQLEAALAGMQQFLMAARGPAETVQRIGRVRQMLAQLPEQDYYRRVSAYQQTMAGDLYQRLAMLRAVSNPQPPQPGDLPEGLVTRFIGKHGRLLLKVYSKVDVWDMEGMAEFVRDVREVDPEATGNPLQIYEASRHMKKSFEHAAWYTLLGIVPVVLFDFRRLSYVFFAALPMGAGLLQMFGLMGFLDIRLNPANMITLPFIIGIGLENGVNIVHDFRRQGPRYRRMSSATSVAVMINSLTTMVGFGALMIAQHQGLQSLGRALTIGMACCLFSSLVLPNLFCVLRQGRLAAGARQAAIADDLLPSVGLDPPSPAGQPAFRAEEEPLEPPLRPRIYDAA